MKPIKATGIGLIVIAVILFGISIGLEKNTPDELAMLLADYSQSEHLYQGENVQVVVDNWDAYLAALWQKDKRSLHKYINDTVSQYCPDDSYDLVPLMLIAHEQNDDFTVTFGGKVLIVVQNGAPKGFIPDSECGAFSFGKKSHWDWVEAYAEVYVYDAYAYVNELEKKQCTLRVRGLCQKNISGYYLRSAAHSHSERIKISQLAAVQTIPKDESGFFENLQ